MAYNLPLNHYHQHHHHRRRRRHLVPINVNVLLLARPGHTSAIRQSLPDCLFSP